MRIALIADSISRTNGGIAPVMYALAGKIAAQGHEVCLFGTDDSYAAGDCTAAGVAWHTAPALWRKGIRYAPGLKRLLREFAPDLVHIHGIWCYAELAAADMHLPYIVSPHGMLDPWALKNSQWKKKIFAALFEHRVFENAAAIHALCKAEAEETEVFHPGKRIVTIPNGIDLPSESSPFPAVDGKKNCFFWDGFIRKRRRRFDSGLRTASAGELASGHRRMGSEQLRDGIASVGCAISASGYHISRSAVRGGESERLPAEPRIHPALVQRRVANDGSGSVGVWFADASDGFLQSARRRCRRSRFPDRTGGGKTLPET